jgi:hypothetical protein
MAQREVDIKNAEAAGRIQFAINLLNTRLNYFIQVLKITYCASAKKEQEL